MVSIMVEAIVFRYRPKPDMVVGKSLHVDMVSFHARRLPESEVSPRGARFGAVA